MAKLQGQSRQSILTDHLGTPLEMVNQSGQTSWLAQTTSYGRVRMEAGTRNACPFRFQGQYENVETGLYHNRFRYYAPEEGMYVSRDLIKLEGGIELYAYVHNPITWADVFGLSGCEQLSDEMASTFLEGEYSTRMLDRDIILYRAGEKAKPLWQFSPKTNQ